jgi:hypothetical protein
MQLGYAVWFATIRICTAHNRFLPYRTSEVSVCVCKLLIQKGYGNVEVRNSGLNGRDFIGKPFIFNRFAGLQNCRHREIRLLSGEQAEFPSGTCGTFQGE